MENSYPSSPLAYIEWNHPTAALQQMRERYPRLPCPEGSVDTSLDGKTVIVTGAASAMG